jgi:hypothetical protein
MIKNIHTLIGDIEHVVENEGWLTEANVERLTGDLRRQLVQRGRQENSRAVLSLSKMGEKCPCHLWHSVRSPGLQEPLPAAARIKFAYGDVIESLGISLAKAAGHKVTGEQDECIVDGISGHRDCVIDGCIVDVKSTNSLSFQKIKSGYVAEDVFLAAYLAQLDGYLVGAADDPLVRVKDRGYLLAIDKVLGKMCLYEHRVRPEFIKNRIRDYKQIVSCETAPECTCGIIPDGESGNLKLDLPASYNPYKHLCAARRGDKIRTFLYEGGPRFLVKVVRRPMRRDNKTPIPEVDRNGKIVYN